MKAMRGGGTLQIWATLTISLRRSPRDVLPERVRRDMVKAAQRPRGVAFAAAGFEKGSRQTQSPLPKQTMPKASLPSSG